MITLNEKRSVVENTPWNLLTSERLNSEEFYSGFVLKAFRVSKGWNARSMACRLGIQRISAMNRLERLDRLGIKRAKELSKIFSIPEYRVFRERKHLEKFRPSKEAESALISVDDLFDSSVDHIVNKRHTLGEAGQDAIKVLVKSKKRKFPAEIEGISLIVEKV